LVYTLLSEPKIQEASRRWPFSKENVHWLYDEFDINQGGSQRHDVRVSNGKTIQLTFRDVQLIKDKVDAELEVA